ncbi:MAG: [LysW]-lysine hydrolase [Phycisphaerales bacterium]|nr:[LysW]-lysine hydrolase [Phycisphaerales bacterium]
MSGCDDRAAIEVLVDLVRTPSVSGSERAAVEVFVRRARDLGLSASIDEAGNGVAWKGAAPDSGRRATQIMLLGHIDTVPGEIPVRVEGGELHGRGSVDAKGPLAAMLSAAARAEVPPGATVIVAAAVGEETPHSAGAHALAARYHPDACIIGEPSAADGVTLGYKGRLLAHAVASFSSRHTAGPEGSSADRLFDWWSAVVDMVGQLNSGVAAEFERVQASIRSMGSRQDGLTDAARVTAGFRLPERMDPHALERRLVMLAPPGISLAFEGHERACRSGRNDAVVRALSGAIRGQGLKPRPKLKTGTADFNVVAPVWRCPIAAYGPGDSALDHTPEERLGLDEYLVSVRVLTEAIPALVRELVGSRPEASLTV